MFETPKTDDGILTQGHNAAVVEEDFVPVYARGGRSATGAAGGKIKTWMILVPLGLLVVGGIGAVVLTSGEQAPIAPLAEPAFTAPVLPSAAAPVEVADAPAARVQTAPVTLVETAPVVRQTAPVPARRAAPAREARPRTVTAPVVRQPAPVTPAGPQSYAPAPAATTTLNSTPATPRPTPAPTPAPAPTPPIVIVPVG